MKLSILLAFMLIVTSCSSDIKEMQKVYDNKTEVMQLFISKTLLRGRQGEKIYFYTYLSGKTNKYVFGGDNNHYFFENDSIEYNLDILQFKSHKEDTLYKYELELSLNNILGEMDKLAISDFRSDWSPLGIDLKIYMKSNGIILYVSDPQKIKVQRFKDYVNSMKKFDEHWYYSRKDK
jgi:hypothetical protein